MPFFSIVIPVYSRALLIEATVNSVFEQVFDDYELIIVNDGSNDNTEEVIKGIPDLNKKIIYIWQSNSERGAARNNGFKMASGTYVIFLDSDDLITPEYLATLYKKIMEQNFPNFITVKYLLRRNGKDSISALLRSLREGYYDINLQLRGSVFACNFALKKDNPALKLFVEDRNYSSSEDWMFIMQNLEHDRVYLIDKYMIIMNDHDNRSMRGNNMRIIKKHLLAAVWMERKISLTSKQKRILWGYCYHFCAIYSYIDGKTGDTFQYLFKSVRLIGIGNASALLLIKNIIGYKLIQNLKR